MSLRLVIGGAAVAALVASVVWGRWSLPKARRARAELLRQHQGRTVTVYLGPKSLRSETGRVVEVDEEANRLVLDISGERRSVLLGDVASVSSALGTRLDDW